MTTVPNSRMNIIELRSWLTIAAVFGDFFVGKSFSQFKKVEPFIRWFERIKN